MSETKTPYVTKLKAKEQRYAQKQAQRIKGTEAEIFHDLFETIISIQYALFRVGTLQKRGAIGNNDALVEFKKITDLKFNTFIESMPPEKKAEYEQGRNEAENFFYLYSKATPEQQKRTRKFLESIFK